MLNLQLPPPASRLGGPGCGDRFQQLHRRLGAIHRRQNHFHAARIDVGPGRRLDLSAAELAFTEGLHQRLPVDGPAVRVRELAAVAITLFFCEGSNGNVNRSAGNKAAVDGEGGFPDRVDVFRRPVDRQRHLPAATLPESLGDVDPSLAPLLVDGDAGAATFLGEAVGETCSQDRYPGTRTGHGRDLGRDSAPQVGTMWHREPTGGTLKLSGRQRFCARSRTGSGVSKSAKSELWEQ